MDVALVTEQEEEADGSVFARNEESGRQKDFEVSCVMSSLQSFVGTG
jgi:hypothetical protein